MLVESSALGTGQTVASQGIIHGDLRPRNVFLAKKKKREIVKLLDTSPLELEHRAILSRQDRY